MSIETLNIETENVNGTLRRIWTVIEQRGWFVRCLLVEESGDGAKTWVQVSPYGERKIETLRRQIERLVNVRSVKLEQRSRVRPSMFKEIPHTEVVL
ncbi:ACT domain-containing protein [Parvularcula marina]|uniref:ACT domain-containing protein n=1 Tax=Parvularcula marina TaxID=2292771 RepID=UPI003515B9F2